MARLQRFIFGISGEEATFTRRGFYSGLPDARQRLEFIGESFLKGYHAALEQGEPEALARRLDTTDLEFRGFAFEGAAMALALLNFLTPWRANRLQSFLNGPGAPHIYMVHVGVGWALARLPWTRRRVESSLEGLTPLLRWLAVDGYGFHEGYFHSTRYVDRQAIPARLSGYARRAFDQGLGRSLWFVDGADVARISNTIAAFHPARHPDLWSGVGLACAYAGGADCLSLEALRTAAGPYRPHVAQGSAFAAKARQRAGNPSRQTELACEILCGVPGEFAAAVTDTALKSLPEDAREPAYEVWRERIQARFAAQEARVAASC